MKLVISFCLLLFPFALFAQTTDQADPLRPSQPVNTPDSLAVNKLARDSTRTGSAEKVSAGKPPVPPTFRYRFTSDGTVTSGNVNRTLLQLTSAIDWSSGKLIKFSSNPSFTYGRQSGLLAEREWLADFRTTYRPDERLYYLVFGSLEKSNLRQIARRYSLAGGAGYKLINHKRAYLSITNVIIHENTDFIEVSDVDIWRNSTRVYGEYTFGADRLSISHSGFYQPAFGLHNVRWNASVSLQIKMTASVSLRTTVANSYESVVATDRKNNDFRWTMGLVYERK